MHFLGSETYRYCPQCGGELEERLLKAGEPPRLVCKTCGFVFYIDPKLAVIALVPLERGLVLARRAIDPGYGLWVVPGGFVDAGEPLEEAVVRETLEETLLQVEVVRLFNVYSYRHSRTVVAAYLTRYLGGNWPRATRPWRPGFSAWKQFLGRKLPSAPPGMRLGNI
jgi:ADP-ribose pyrophosphatase YjhB (NUDIX family)